VKKSPRATNSSPYIGTSAERRNVLMRESTDVVMAWAGVELVRLQAAQYPSPLGGVGRAEAEAGGGGQRQ